MASQAGCGDVKEGGAMNATKANPLITTKGMLSLYRQIEDRLREEISCGNFKEGDLVPSEFELADRYGVSQGTVRKAILNLTQQGIFYRKQGKGTFVVFQKTGPEKYKNFRFVNGLDTNLLDVNTSFKRVKVVRANAEVAEALNMPNGASVIHFERTGRFGEAGRLHTISFLPHHMHRGLERYTAEDFKKNTLWKLQEIYFGIHIENREEFISALVADEETARLVGTVQGAAVLRIEVRLTTGDGTAVEYRRTHIHLGRMKYYRWFLNSTRVENALK
jgi:GntR family transcriptional regulator